MERRSPDACSDKDVVPSRSPKSSKLESLTDSKCDAGLRPSDGYHEADAPHPNASAASSFLIRDILKDAREQQAALVQQVAVSAGQLNPMAFGAHMNPFLTGYPQDLSLRSASLLTGQHPAALNPAFLFGRPGMTIRDIGAERLGSRSDAGEDTDNENVEDDCSSDADSERNCNASIKSNSSSKYIPAARSRLRRLCLPNSRDTHTQRASQKLI